MDDMVECGAEGIVLGCTDLPLLIQNYKIPLFDTIKILAESTVRYATRTVNKGVFSK